MSKGRYFCGGSVLAVTLAMALGVSPSLAYAQPPAEDPQEDVVVEEIISTGTIIRGAAEDSAINVEVMGREDLLSRGSPTGEDLIRGLSEIGNLQGAAANRFNADGIGIAAVNLRSMGSGRTLSMLNGVRLADDPTSSGATGSAGFVTGGANQNINSIPMAAVQQVELLKDSGGATYGSDAVGGVVNFITRKDIHGMELNVAYKAIPGSDFGDVDASILWGRRNEGGNVLLGFEMTQISALSALETRVEPFYINGGNLSGSTTSPYATAGTYVFNVRGNTPISATGAAGTVNQYLGNAAGNNPNNFPAIGLSAFGTINGLREDACLEYGGLNGFAGATAPTPACYAPIRYLQNAYDGQAFYRVLGDVNLDFGSVRYHGEFLASKSITRLYDGTEAYAVGAPCDPIPVSATIISGNAALTRACTPGSPVGYYAPGFNPAVWDYMRRSFTNPIAGARVPVFSDAQIAAVTGLTRTGAQDPASAAATSIASGGLNNGLSVTQAYIPNGFGRVQIGAAGGGNWMPFMIGPNPGFEGGRAPARQENVSYRTTQRVEGDLGSILGSDVEYTLSATYQYNANRYKDFGIMADRLQRALNGFATNLDDLGADGLGCTSTETAGTRRLNIVQGTLSAVMEATGVPYTTGAGGGAGRASNGFDPGAQHVGNRCFFFNPFFSAYPTSRIVGQAPRATATDTGFVEPTDPNALDYQGYARGYGLGNAPGIARWLYEERENRQQNDSIFLNARLNGVIEPFELPGGPIAWGLGGEYRYVHRVAAQSGLADPRITPCTFLNQSIGALDSVGNNVNATSTCGTQGGPFAEGSGTGAQEPTASRAQSGFRQNVIHALFAEVQAPILETVSTNFKLRYEEQKTQGGRFIGALTGAASVKWQATPQLAFRLSGSETFDIPNVDDVDSTVSQQRNTGTSFYGTAIAATAINPATQTINHNNVNLQPEHGFNGSAGILFSTQDRSFTASIDYFYNYLAGAGSGVTLTNFARALQGATTASQALVPGLPIDCSDPLVQSLFTDVVGAPIGRPIVQYINSNNEVLPGGCRAGTTIEGLDVDGGGVTGAADLGLSYAYLNALNLASRKVSGVELAANWRVPKQIYGGDLALSLDLTVNLRHTVSPVTFLGVAIADFTDSLGTNTGLQYSIMRGNAAATYARGPHVFSLQAFYTGGFADNGAATFPGSGGSIPGSHLGNLNPRDTAACAALNLSQIKVPVNPAVPRTLEPVLTGEMPYNPACNVPLWAGSKLASSIQWNLTYRVDLPWMEDTTLTATLDNIFDTTGAFYKANFNYNGFSGIGPAGRTLKVGIRKKFFAQ